MGSYAELDAETQIALLRPVAVEGARLLGLEVSAIAPVHHGYNTTFRVRTPGQVDYAVRVLTNSLSTPAHLLAQHAWMHALARDTTVVVPNPVTGPDGLSYAVVENEALERPFTVAAASWLAGDDVGEPSLQQAHELGVTMATMHNHALTWSPPEGSSLPVFDEPLFGDEDRLASLMDAELPDGGRRVLEVAFERARIAFAEAFRAQVLPIHADLHGGNLKWHNDELAVFDFDDSGFGTAALDLAISTFYLREAFEGAEAGLRQGYQAMRDLPQLDPDAFEALVASRQLLLANALLTTSTASLRADSEAYLLISIERLRHWLEVGRFTRTLPT
ncbi:phosphotransferase enzyme family protein [Pseudactinotalea suaedae]|uniref:phosphotransferase enzyme family protein n=1 Tax=Pseudactinotalea suaedae TaxID=1524924 RepID=UPI0012E12F3C|nr:phosphotransferase [Pseudactinotalea suaedae]